MKTVKSSTLLWDVTALVWDVWQLPYVKYVMMIMVQSGLLQLLHGRYIFACLRSDDAECKEFADNLYNTLQNKGIEVIYDDRKARPGAMFADADLLGVPVRVVVSPRNLKESVVELSTRDKSIQKKVPMNEIEQEVDNVIKQLTDSIYEKVK